MQTGEGMTTKQGKYRVTVSTDCTCHICPECSILYSHSDERCESCDGEIQPTTYCDGYCQETVKEDAEWLVSMWMATNNIDSYEIVGENMGWQRLSGKTVPLCEPTDVFTQLAINGDYLLEFVSDREHKELRIIRRSHDELGALFTLEKA